MQSVFGVSDSSSQGSSSARLVLALALAAGLGCGSKSETAVVGVSGATGGKAATGTGGGSALANGGRTGSGGGVLAMSGGVSGSTGGSTGGAGRGTGGAVAASGGATGASGGQSSAIPMVGPCRIFPADNPWNRDVSADPIRSDSATYIAKMLPTRGLHPDWGTVTDLYGIPFTTGTGATPQPITWTESYGSTESDRLPCATGGNLFCYPIPLTSPIEGGPGAPTDSDRHVLYLDTAGAPDNCTLYELYAAMNPPSGGSVGWRASNGAIFHLGSNDLRTAGWTSADAAGLPILPGLVRLDEVKAGAIRHAIRFTMNNSYQGYIHPAVHAAGSSDATLPPMGLRLRLKATYDTSSTSGATLVILTAMKKYGIILADNGSDWYITGESNEGWAPIMDGIVSGLSKVKGGDFEVVDSGAIVKDGL